MVRHVTLRCASHALGEVGGWCKWLLLRKLIFPHVRNPEFEPEPSNTLWCFSPYKVAAIIEIIAHQRISWAARIAQLALWQLPQPFLAHLQDMQETRNHCLSAVKRLGGCGLNLALCP